MIILLLVLFGVLSINQTLFFKQYIAWAKNQSDRKHKAIHSDQGGNCWVTILMLFFLAKQDIEHQLSVAKILQRNGRAERLQQNIQTKAEAMQHYAGLSPMF